jgi:hypothetical protein
LEEKEASWLSGQQQWHKVAIRFARKIPVEEEEELAKAIRPTIRF